MSLASQGGSRQKHTFGKHRCVDGISSPETSWDHQEREVNKKTEMVQELNPLTLQCLEVTQMRRKQQWWLGKESSEAEGKQECAWILRVWKVRDWEVVNHHACKSGRKTEDRWKNDHWLWQHQGDRQPCSESFRGMWTKVQWVRGVKREWGSTDNSLQDFCYMVEKEVRLRGFYFKTGEKVASL